MAELLHLGVLQDPTSTPTVQKPTVGRIVFYGLRDGHVRPAIITYVYPEDVSVRAVARVDLYVVFPRPVKGISISADPQPGRWSWPPR